MQTRIRMSTIRVTDGRGWRRPGFGGGARIPILGFAVPEDLAGIAAFTGLGMAGVDTEVAETAHLVAYALEVATVAHIEVRATTAPLAEVAAVAAAVPSVAVPVAATTVADIADRRRDIASKGINNDRTETTGGGSRWAIHRPW
jgi:hypothetical protein